MKALFLDRDGVVNKRIVGGYVTTTQEFEFLPDIVPILRHAQQLEYLCILISNQQGVGKGLMSRRDLDEITEYMQQIIAQHGVMPLNAAYYCTDLINSGSLHRKPAPGMILDAINTYNLIPEQCWMLGDSIVDAQAGRNAGIHTALIGDFPTGTANLIASDHQEMLTLLERNLL